MKKTRIIAVILAAVMLLSMIPVTAGAADERHPIVKDVIEFSGLHASSDSYFALGDSLYNSDGDCIFTLGDEDEMIYTLTDHCMITVCTNIGSLRDDENPGSLEDLELGFNLYSINGDEVTLKSSFDNYRYVLTFNGNDYTTVLHVDFMNLFDDPFGSGFEEADIRDLIFGYDIINEYGDVIYSEEGKKLAGPVGNGLIIETEIISTEEERTSVLTIDENGVKKTNLGYELYNATSLGDLLVWNVVRDEESESNKVETCGVIGADGEVIVPLIFDEVSESDGYYVGYTIDSETYEDWLIHEYESSCVYDLEGNVVYESEDTVTYYNGIVAVIYTEITLWEEYISPIMQLIDLSTGEVIVDAENIYCEGGYIFAESTMGRPFGTSVYSMDGKFIGGKNSWMMVRVDEGNSTIIFEDADAEKTYRVNSNMEVVETLPYDVILLECYNNVTIPRIIEEASEEKPFGAFVHSLVYKGQQISDGHERFYEMFIMEGCEVYIFVDYSNDSLYNSYTAYVLDKDRSPFYDIHEDHWARDYIDGCFNAGIMDGTGGGKFSPSMDVSRAQVVTTLWRLAGEPEPEDENKFVDVQNVLWYSTAVAWAAENGITTGVGGNYFAPNRTVTRGEVAAILYRYAKYAGEDVSARADFASFADAGELTDWNRDAFAWCVANGIISGKTSGQWNPVYLAPSDALSRAEIAAILYRYGLK